MVKQNILHANRKALYNHDQSIKPEYNNVLITNVLQDKSLQLPIAETIVLRKNVDHRNPDPITKNLYIKI